MEKTVITEKTGIIVTAYIWDEEKGYSAKQFDIADLKPGMMVREIGGLLEVTGATIDDGIDYMICTKDGYYSPLCIDTAGTEIKASPESEHKIDFISIDDDGNEHEWHFTVSELVDAMNNRDELPEFNHAISQCVASGMRLHFTTFFDLFKAFVW